MNDCKKLNKYKKRVAQHHQTFQYSFESKVLTVLLKTFKKGKKIEKYLFAEMKDPDVASYYGCHMRLTVAQGYMSGGAGYVLSRYNERDSITR
jgi:hypothetical protein